MDTQLIIHPNKEGGIAVMHPATECGLSIEEIAAKDVPQGLPHVIVSSSDLPDRYFRRAWTYDFTSESTITIDIEKAKDIQRNKWRAARAPKLAALDLKFMRALEAGDLERQTEIVAEKQALRDVTTTPLPDDIASIKETWPSIL